MCLSQKFISRFIHTLIIVQDCFLIFWFCIKGNLVYYPWITYTPVLLVNIQLLFSHCVKYAEIRAFSDPYFPVCGQDRIGIFPYLDRISENTDICTCRHLFKINWMVSLIFDKISYSNTLGSPCPNVCMCISTPFRTKTSWCQCIALFDIICVLNKVFTLHYIYVRSFI